MHLASLLKFGLPALVAIAAVLASCEFPEQGAVAEATAEDPDDTAHRLRGTWLREYTEQGISTRRVLALEPDGSFNEVVRAADASGEATVFVHAGTWLYDGTNLKRKYTLMNGKPPSRLNVPFATFEIAFQTRNEFTGVDHIHGHKIRYVRVPAGTVP